MSWVFDGTNRIVFSGSNGMAEWQGCLAAAKSAVRLPPKNTGDKASYFVAEGWLFVHQPQL